MKYKLEHAILTWPKPKGIYTRQVIEKWKNKADGECQASSECDEYEVKIEQSRKLYVTIIPVNKEEKANFRLVLFYKNDSVAVFEPPTGKINNQYSTSRTIMYICNTFSCGRVLFMVMPCTLTLRMQLLEKS